MTKYNAHHKDQPINAVTLDKKEYKAKDGIIEVPDDHHAAHDEARAIGLTIHHDKHVGAEKPQSTR
jgi:hypothetical protein